MATLSVRCLWIIYKRTAIKAGLSRREQVSTQLAFYSGARGVLKVLAYLMERGDYEELHATIKWEGRQIERIQSRRPAPETALSIINCSGRAIRNRAPDKALLCEPAAPTGFNVRTHLHGILY
jgi:hypothetical protein